MWLLEVRANLAECRDAFLQGLHPHRCFEPTIPGAFSIYQDQTECLLPEAADIFPSL